MSQPIRAEALPDHPNQMFQDGLLFKLPQILRFLLTVLMQGLIVLFDKISSQQAADTDDCTYLVVV